MLMAENELRKLSKDYASGKIKTDEYRKERKYLIDNITRVERPTPVDSSPENKKEFAKEPIYVFLWLLGLVGAISIVIVALKMGEPEQSPQARIETTQPTANSVPLPPPAKLEEHANFVHTSLEKDDRASILEESLPQENKAQSIEKNVIAAQRKKKVVIQLEQGNISESDRNQEICDNNWLTAQDPERYTLQLCVLSDNVNIQHLLEEYIDLNLKAVRFEDKGVVWIIYGIFNTYEQAEEHSEKIIENLNSSGNGNGIMSKISSSQGKME